MATAAEEAQTEAILRIPLSADDGVEHDRRCLFNGWKRGLIFER